MCILENNCYRRPQPAPTRQSLPKVLCCAVRNVFICCITVSLGRHAPMGLQLGEESRQEYLPCYIQDRSLSPLATLPPKRRPLVSSIVTTFQRVCLANRPQRTGLPLAIPSPGKACTDLDSEIVQTRLCYSTVDHHDKLASTMKLPYDSGVSSITNNDSKSLGTGSSAIMDGAAEAGGCGKKKVQSPRGRFTPLTLLKTTP